VSLLHFIVSLSYKANSPEIKMVANKNGVRHNKTVDQNDLTEVSKPITLTSCNA
jgi:hypothetical protein